MELHGEVWDGKGKGGREGAEDNDDRPMSPLVIGSRVAATTVPMTQQTTEVPPIETALEP